MVFIQYDKTYSLDLNSFVISVYDLKTKIYSLTYIQPEKQILYYNGKLLTDKETLYLAGIHNKSTIQLNLSRFGGTNGFDSFSFLIFLIYLICILIYLLLVISGLIPIIGHSYAYLLEWALTKLGNLFALGDNRYYRAFVFFINFIIRIGIVYFFMYALSAFVIFPIVYYFKDHLCQSFQISNNFGFVMALSFIIIYAIFSIPDEILYLTRILSNTTIYGKVALSPFLGILRSFTDKGKFAGIYAIPFLGTPFLSGYHFALETISTLLMNGLDIVKNYNCDNPASIQALAKMLINWRKTELADWIKSYNLESVAEVLPIAMVPEMKKCYQDDLSQMPFWEKINPFNETASKYYSSNYAYRGFCLGLDLVRALSGMLNSFGGSEQIANYLKTGNVAGVISLLLAPIIALIMWLNGSF